MVTNPFFGVLFHALGGFAAGSFYIPYRKVRSWAWETYWLVGGLFIWIICPLIAALLTIPDLANVYQQAPWMNLAYPFLFGVGWGVGHLTFGLSLRYLGLSLGVGLTLGFCAFFGALVPPVVEGEFLGLFAVPSGRCSLGGVAICLLGIFFCSWAGVTKERQLSDKAKKETIREFNFVKGAWVAFFSGVMSACFAFGVQTGDPIQQLAGQSGAREIYANNAPVLLVLVGGGLTNIVWCIGLNFRNRTGNDYIDTTAPLVTNYVFCTLAGVVAYAEFFFFGMGETQMGNYSFSSWPIHMAFIIVFSNMWGLIFREWKGTSAWTKCLLVVGLTALVVSTLVSGYGSYLKEQEIVGIVFGGAGV